MTTGKTIALISVGKVMSLVFNTLSSFVTAFLAKMAVVIVTVVLEPKRILNLRAMCQNKIRTERASFFFLKWKRSNFKTPTQSIQF